MFLLLQKRLGCCMRHFLEVFGNEFLVDVLSGSGQADGFALDPGRYATTQRCLQIQYDLCLAPWIILQRFKVYACQW